LAQASGRGSEHTQVGLQKPVTQHVTPAPLVDGNSRLLHQCFLGTALQYTW